MYIIEYRCKINRNLVEGHNIYRSALFEEKLK